MPAGYSGTPLVRKLGYGEKMRVAVVGPPANYWDLVGRLPGGVRVMAGAAKELDLVHIFATRRTALERSVRSARKRMAQNGMIWASWPKKAARVPTDITEDVVREIAFPLDLVDVKVCAVDETWSGLKLVIRKERRS